MVTFVCCICILGRGRYIYFETSSPVESGDIAVLESETIRAYSPVRCLKFAYNMYGDDMGQLVLLGRWHHGQKQVFYNDISDHGWKEFQVTLPNSPVDFKVSKISQN